MSMIRCDLCENLIDSDEDPACFVEGNPSGCFCKACRDQAEAEAERAPRAMPRDWQPTPEQRAFMGELDAAGCGGIK